MADPDRHEDEPREPEGGASAWGRPVALAASMLVLGFVGGWILRGDDGPVTVVPAATTTTADQGDATTTDGGDATTETTDGTTTADTSGDTTADTTATAPETTTAPATPPARDTIALAVLNGTSTTGLAGQNATTAEGLGYTGVEAGNAPTQTGPSVVYYRPGEEAAADVVAQDFQVSDVQELPASGPLATAVPAGAQVALVLGPG